jgi:hypothetical protein
MMVVVVVVVAVVAAVVMMMMVVVVIQFSKVLDSSQKRITGTHWKGKIH